MWERRSSLQSPFTLLLRSTPCQLVAGGRWMFEQEDGEAERQRGRNAAHLSRRWRLQPRGKHPPPPPAAPSAASLLIQPPLAAVPPNQSHKHPQISSRHSLIRLHFTSNRNPRCQTQRNWMKKKPLLLPSLLLPFKWILAQALHIRRYPLIVFFFPFNPSVYSCINFSAGAT